MKKPKSTGHVALRARWYSPTEGTRESATMLETGDPCTGADLLASDGLGIAIAAAAAIVPRPLHALACAVYELSETLAGGYTDHDPDYALVRAARACVDFWDAEDRRTGVRS